MPQALIFHEDKLQIIPLVKYLKRRRVEVFHTATFEQIEQLIQSPKKFEPGLVIIDLHLPHDEWLRALRRVTSLFPKAGVLFATDQSDPNLVLRAKAHGAQYFIRAPYTEDALQHALRRMSQSHRATDRLKTRLPDIKMPVRFKIVLPYVVLAIFIILGAAYVVSRIARQSVEERFVSQLIDTALLSSEWMVREEDRMLDTLRLLANTQGMATAVMENNAEALRNIILPLAINEQEEVVAVLNANEENVVTVQHVAGGGIEEYAASRDSQDFYGLAFVHNIYALRVDELGDKYSGLVFHADGPYFYVAGPLFSEAGNPVGILLVGESVETLARRMREDTLAHISFYSEEGELYSSTLLAGEEDTFLIEPEEVGRILNQEEKESFIRPLSFDQGDYREIIGSWKARREVGLGLIGVSLPETILVQANTSTSTQIFLFMVLALALVVLVGLLVSRQITNPLLQVVNASAEISQGNYDVKVNIKGNDEVSILAYSFNKMIEGLREGSMYRDLLGRSVSPEVRDQLRDTLSGGNINLEGQDAMATILLADVKGFTALSEQEDPATVLNWLNELFGELAPIINLYSGVVNEFTGDALFAFFGILPRPLHMAESAYLACRTALEMVEAIERINKRRMERGDPKIQMGIGINSGPVTAGGLGAEDRLHYTVIGDTVNTAQRIESLAHELDESAIMISKQTAMSIWDQQDRFKFIPAGSHSVKGKEGKVDVYRLMA